MERKQSELTVITKAKDLCSYVMTVTQKSPKHFRYAETKLHLSFNEKTEIFPIRNGVNYLGWHFYLTETGKVVRKVKQSTKIKYKRRLRYLQECYSAGFIEFPQIQQTLSSYRAHLSFGHTYRLQEKVLNEFSLVRHSEKQ